MLWSAPSTPSWDLPTDGQILHDDCLLSHMPVRLIVLVGGGGVRAHSSGRYHSTEALWGEGPSHIVMPQTWQGQVVVVCVLFSNCTLNPLLR